jgi:hypothetical protein
MSSSKTSEKTFWNKKRMGGHFIFSPRASSDTSCVGEGGGEQALFAEAVITQCHRLIVLSNRNVFSQNFRG